MKTQIEFSAAAQLAEHAINSIPELIGTYCCDLRNEIFNSDYWIIGRFQAEQWLIECGGVFFCIGLVSDYEKDNFGERYTEEHVSNMVAYIEGETVLSMSETLRENWDEALTEEMAEKIVSELKEEFGI